MPFLGLHNLCTLLFLLLIFIDISHITSTSCPPIWLSSHVITLSSIKIAWTIYFKTNTLQIIFYTQKQFLQKIRYTPMPVYSIQLWQKSYTHPYINIMFTGPTIIPISLLCNQSYATIVMAYRPFGVKPLPNTFILTLHTPPPPPPPPLFLQKIKTSVSNFNFLPYYPTGNVLCYTYSEDLMMQFWRPQQELWYWPPVHRLASSSPQHFCQYLWHLESPVQAQGLESFWAWTGNASSTVVPLF